MIGHERGACAVARNPGCGTPKPDHRLAHQASVQIDNVIQQVYNEQVSLYRHLREHPWLHERD